MLRLTDATEERDEALEAASREWRLAELLRQQLAGETCASCLLDVRQAWLPDRVCESCSSGASPRCCASGWGMSAAPCLPAFSKSPSQQAYAVRQPGRIRFAVRPPAAQRVGAAFQLV